MFRGAPLLIARRNPAVAVSTPHSWVTLLPAAHHRLVAALHLGYFSAGRCSLMAVGGQEAAATPQNLSNPDPAPCTGCGSS